MIGGDLLLLNWALVGLCSPLLLFVVIVVQANCGDVDDDDYDGGGGGRLMTMLCCFICCMVCCWCSSTLAGDDWHLWCVCACVCVSGDIVAAGRLLLDLLLICSSFCVRVVCRSVDEIRVGGGQPIAGWAS